VRDGEFLVALDVQSGRRGEGSEARIRIASVVDRAWLQPTATEVRHEVTPDGRVQRVDREMYGALVLRERRSSAGPAEAAEKLVEAFLAGTLSGEQTQLLRRLRFAGIETELRDIVGRAAHLAARLDDIDLENGLDWREKQQLETLAPRQFTAPSGRSHTLDYREDGTVALPIKLQELFGLADTPRIGPRREPLLILLLAPNGRPVQTTRDLRSFWNVTYPDVRKELRGRYPKHPWPEDPWTAPATARTRRSSRP
jgi:ATP-dependent helicase HrpB